MKSTVIIYVVGATKDANNVKCPVPWRVNNKEIFFGPCKKNLRSALKNKYLKDNEHFTVKDNIYFIGLNASNAKKPRKIIFAGKIKKLMTFEYAFNNLEGGDYTKMKDGKRSPLHVKPSKKGSLNGYMHRENGHHSIDWQKDLSSNSKTHNSMLVEKKDADRDCCILLNNIFWADGEKKYSSKVVEGLKIDANLLELLKECQPEAKDVDETAVFGKDARNASIGLRGQYLEISGNLADKIINWLNKSIL